MMRAEDDARNSQGQLEVTCTHTRRPETFASSSYFLLLRLLLTAVRRRSLKVARSYSELWPTVKDFCHFFPVYGFGTSSHYTTGRSTGEGSKSLRTISNGQRVLPLQEVHIK